MENQNSLEIRESDRCPLTGAKGEPLRNYSGQELANAYETHFGKALSPELVTRYFEQNVQEFHSSSSGLRWFSPAVIAGEEFYQLLDASYPWYYTKSTWDKHYAVRILKQLGVANFVEIGCGDGAFLEMASAAGLKGIGVDTNRVALEKLTAKGYNGLLPEAFTKPDENVDALVMLQVLEHVPEPLEFVRHYVKCCDPNRIIIAVPSHETLLARVSDPLAWPPHHVTMWSQRAFECLGELTGYTLSHTAYPPMTYLRFVQLFNHEDGGQSPLGALRRRRGDGASRAEASDVVARWIRNIGSVDRRTRDEQRTDLPSKLLRKLYRDVLRPLDEPTDTDLIGPRFGRLKWLTQRLLRRPWATRDFWMLVVLDKRR